MGIDLSRLKAAIPENRAIVLDTAPLVAYFGGGEAVSPVAVLLVDDWIQEGRNTGVISVVSVAELLVGPMRARSGVADVLDFLKHFPNLSLADVDFDIASAAAAVRAATNLKLPDALVIATGQHWKAGAIVTNDDAWKKKCPTLPIVTLGDF